MFLCLFFNLLNFILECFSNINLCAALCLNVYLQNGRFLNGHNWNDISFRDCSQSQFYYHHQVPHHGWDSFYAGGTYVPYHGWDFRSAGGTYVPHHISESTISAVGPLHRPQPKAYCKICKVKLSSYKNLEEHNRGKKHQRMLKPREDTETLRIANGKIPNSQVDLAVQPKKILKSGENGCKEKKVISEATVSKHKNKGVTSEVPDEGKPRDNTRVQGGVTSEVPAEGKPRDNTRVQGAVTSEVPVEGKPRDNTNARGHNFKRKISGAKTGKYMKTNDGVRRPMEASKLDINSPSAYVESPVQLPALATHPTATSHTVAPSPVVGSSFKFVYQHILAFQTQVLAGKEYHDIPNPTVETRNHPHAASYSNINPQPEVVSSDSAAKGIKPSKMGYCKICEVHLPPPGKMKELELHNKGKRHQRMLRHGRELKQQQILGSQKSSNEQISNSHKNLVVQQKTEKNGDPLKMSSEASMSEHKNYLQKGMGLTSEFAAKGPEMKPTDNSGGHSHGFNHKSRRAETGKYMKNDEVRRPVESSKLNINSQLKSVESPVQNSIPALAPLPGPIASHIIAPTLVVESSLEPQIQHISSSQTPVSEGNEHYEIENPNVEATDQPHGPADSNINIQTEDMGSDSAAMAMAPSVGFMTSQVFAPSLAVASNCEPQIQHVFKTCVLEENKKHHEIQNPTLKTNYQPPTSARSSSELQIQHVLHIETESQLSEGTTDPGSQNCTEKNNQLLPSVLAEFNSPSCCGADAHSADGCSNHEQEMDIITRPSGSGTTQRSQVLLIFYFYVMLTNNSLLKRFRYKIAINLLFGVSELILSITITVTGWLCITYPL